MEVIVMDNRYIDNDIDTNIERRKELIEIIKEMSSKDDSEIDMRELSSLKKRWNRIPSWDSAYEAQLEEEFDQYVGVIEGKRHEIQANNQKAKQDIIKEAREVMNIEDQRESIDKMSSLMERWKAVRSAGREVDEVLWQEFSAIRKEFFDKRRQYFDELKEKFAAAKAVKEELITKAAEYAKSTDVEKTSEIYRELMQKWKEAGSAGREHDDDLWERFSLARQPFFDYRKTYYDELKKQQAEYATKKDELIKKAKEISEKGEYTREDTAAMKELNVLWKEVPTCGRYRDERLWRKFKGLMDGYFMELKRINEEKHENWKQRMEDAKVRKQELINDQESQINRLEHLTRELLGESAIEEVEAKIEDKKQLIDKLKEEIADIDNTLKDE